MTSTCTHDPRSTHAHLCMYHCPECGQMVIAAMAHPDYALLNDNAEFDSFAKVAADMQAIPGPDHHTHPEAAYVIGIVHGFAFRLAALIGKEPP